MAEDSAKQQIKVAPIPAWAVVSEPLTVPDDVRGPLFLRRQDSQIHIDRSGQRAFVSSLIKVLDTSALQLGNVSFSWNPASGTPMVHAIKVHRDGAVRDVLAEAKFEIIRRENQLEIAVLDGTLTALLRVPDLRVGDELEIAYTVPTRDPTLGEIDAGLLFLLPVPAPGRVALRLTWDGQPAPQIKATRDLEAQLRRDAQSVSIAFDNAPALTIPKEAPPRFAWQRVIQFSDFADWPAVSAKLAPLFAKASVLPANSPVRREAEAIAAAQTDPLARTSAALKLVQQQVRYVYVGLNGGNLTPADAETTWQRRYGDCKGKTALLLALLNQLGIEAEAVMVNNSNGDDGLDQRLPTSQFFDHVLVRARVSGQTYWLDPTLPHHYRPSLAPVTSYRWVLPLAAGGAALEKVPLTLPTVPDETTVYEIDARAGFDVPAGIRTLSIKRGKSALLEYVQMSAISESQLDSSLREGLEGGDTFTTVDTIKWHFDPQELASVLEISGKGPVEWEKYGDKSRWLELPGGGFNPPDRRQRSGKVDPAVPFYREPEFDCRVTTVRFPTTTPDKDWSRNTNFDQTFYGASYQRRFDRRDGSMRMIRAYRVLEPEITTEQAAADNARLEKFNNSKAVLYYDKGSVDGPPSKDRIPASYEIDWVRQSDACSLKKLDGK